MPALDDRERADWLQLIRTPSIGPITFYQLLARYGSARDALDALPDIARTSGRARPLRAASRDRAEAELDAAFSGDVRVIAACEDAYPRLLKVIADPPPLLFMRGHPELFEHTAIAIVGARNASGVGRKMARTLAADLGAAGVVIVSGLARGIDGAAHAAALDTGTIAVVAGGVDVVYPPDHAALTEDIASRGAVISECPLGYHPTARDFPRRNRLISGLARGVIIVEAASRSGTLITARCAVEQNREVFAVPGSPLDSRSQGANKLLRDGATLVERADDVLSVLAEQVRGAEESEAAPPPWSPDPTVRSDADAVAAIRDELRALLSYTPQHRDALRRECDAPAGLFADALLDLVLMGVAEEQAGGLFALAADGADAP